MVKSVQSGRERDSDALVPFLKRLRHGREGYEEKPGTRRLPVACSRAERAFLEDGVLGQIIPTRLLDGSL